MSDKNEHPLLRLIDSRIPLPWLVAVIVAAAGMFFQLRNLAEAVVSLQIEVKAGNQSWATLASEQALQKFRVSNVEQEVERQRAAITLLQARK